MLTSISPSISLNEASKEFTNGDVLLGCALVRLDKSTELEDITIRYLIRAKITVRVTNGEHSVAHRETRILYEDSCRVFPHSELVGRTFKLLPGEHSFDYSFVIPEHKSLPASFLDKFKENSITHLIEVQVKRSSWFKMNADAHVVFKFMPQPSSTADFRVWPSKTEPIKLDLHDKRQGVFSRRKSQVSATIRAQKSAVVNGTLSLSLRLHSIPWEGDEKQPLKVTDILIKLKSVLRLSVKQGSDLQPQSDRVLFNQKNIDGLEGELINLDIELLKLDEITPSIFTPTLELRWYIEMRLRVSNCYRRQTEVLKHELDLCIVTEKSPVYEDIGVLPEYTKRSDYSNNTSGLPGYCPR